MSKLTVPGKRLLFVHSIIAIAALVGVVEMACSHEYYTADFKIIHPWAIPTLAGATSAEVYVRFEEITGTDRLIGAKSEVADKVEMLSPEGAQIEAVELTIGATVALEPKGAHFLLHGLKGPLLYDRSYPITFIFEKTGDVDSSLSMGGH